MLARDSRVCSRKRMFRCNDKLERSAAVFGTAQKKGGNFTQSIESTIGKAVDVLIWLIRERTTPSFAILKLDSQMR